MKPKINKRSNKSSVAKSTISEYFNVLSSNANGLKFKLESLKYLVKHLNIGLFTLQETKLMKKGKVKIEGFELFEAFRKKDGGGTLIGAHKTLEPILIQEYSEDFELIIVEIKIEDNKLRVISGYGPQETWTLDKRMPFLLL